jgi:hypothetical protein
LDWLAVNQRLISIQRLRNLAREDGDRALIEAVVGWLGERRRRARLEARAKAGKSTDPEPFFRNSRLPIADPDPAFLAQGLVKPKSEPSGKSQAPQVLLPINFAFRLRLLLGIGGRAEAMRMLLTIDAPRANIQAIAASTAYTKRNVQEAVTSSAPPALWMPSKSATNNASPPHAIAGRASSRSTSFPVTRTGPRSSPSAARFFAG